MNPAPEIPKWLINSLNQIYNLKIKSQRKGFFDDIERELSRIEENFSEFGLTLHDPMGEKCPDTRTDVEVNISGEGSEDLIIIDVIKPIIRSGTTNAAINLSTIVQKGVVVAESQKK